MPRPKAGTVVSTASSSPLGLPPADDQPAPVREVVQACTQHLPKLPAAPDIGSEYRMLHPKAGAAASVASSSPPGLPAADDSGSGRLKKYPHCGTSDASSESGHSCFDCVVVATRAPGSGRHWHAPGKKKTRDASSRRRFGTSDASSESGHGCFDCVVVAARASGSERSAAGGTRSRSGSQEAVLANGQSATTGTRGRSAPCKAPVGTAIGSMAPECRLGLGRRGHAVRTGRFFTCKTRLCEYNICIDTIAL